MRKSNNSAALESVILQSRDHIKPSARAGRLRLYDRDAMALILLDHDDAGEKYAKDVAELARKAGARSVRVVRLANRWPDLPAGGDMADVLELAGGDAHAVQAAVEELTDAAKPEDPPTPSGPARFAPFPMDVLPEPARALVVRGARALQTDPAMVALGVLAILAEAPLGHLHSVVEIGETGRVGSVSQSSVVAIQFTLDDSPLFDQPLDALLGLALRLLERLSYEAWVAADAADLVDDEPLDLAGRHRLRRAGVPAPLLRLRAHVVPIEPISLLRVTTGLLSG